MADYYFLVASLPFLDYEETPPITTDDFLSACGENLPERDFRQVQSAGDFPVSHPPASGVLAAWNRWEISLRNELVRLRANGHLEKAEADMREGDFIVDTASVARDAFNQESPFMAEEILLDSRWNFLDNLETGHYFDLEKIIIYYLKLQILERKAKFTKDRGLEKYNEIYNHITEKLRTL